MFAAFFALLFGCCAVLSYAFRNTTGGSGHSDSLTGTSKSSEDRIFTSPGASSSSRYLAFRNNYLFVYLCMMASDWLQGPYVYPLYKAYGYGLDEIGVLFIVGFLSSAIFGTVISSLADQYGRKKFCLAFAVIYIASCFTKLSPLYTILLLGRLLGGISTSLLFSVFESWMVSEHFSRGFPPDLLSSTFSWATYGNGLIAIASGLLANGAVSITGALVAPFMLSALFLAIGGLTVFFTWSENYGEIKSISPTIANPVSSFQSMSLVKGLRAASADTKILSVGLIQSLFESSMYIFVFMWGPVLEKEDTKLPFGLVFATFMVCIMIGSILFRVALANRWTVEAMIQPLLLTAAGSLFVPIFLGSKWFAFWAFNLFELCCGVYFPAIGTIRSKYVPEETRTSLMNLFRVPLNLIVVVVLSNVSTWSSESIFTICTVLMITSYGASVILRKNSTEFVSTPANSPLVEQKDDSFEDRDEDVSGVTRI